MKVKAVLAGITACDSQTKEPQGDLSAFPCRFCQQEISLESTVVLEVGQEGGGLTIHGVECPHCHAMLFAPPITIH